MMTTRTYSDEQIAQVDESIARRSSPAMRAARAIDRPMVRPTVKRMAEIIDSETGWSILMKPRVRRIVREVLDGICADLCPLSWPADDERPHHEDCSALRAAFGVASK